QAGGPAGGGGAPPPRGPEAGCYAAGPQPRDARRRAFWLRRAALAGALLAAGCGEQKAAAPPAGADPERGRQGYQAYCTSCHRPDPEQDGPAGPAVKGAARGLLDARVV